MSFTDYLENALLDHVLGGPDYTRPGTVYIALSTTAPTDAGGNLTEPSGNGYARKSVTNNATNFPAASGGSKSNGTTVTFATATGGAWGNITHFAIMDASSGGNMLEKGALSAAKQIDAGDTPEFAPGTLITTLD
jgi:hypothetical protein